ncbi:MAG: hypothetical protein ACRD1H_09400, partial [Vicinamibacterales bacterium]
MRRARSDCVEDDAATSASPSTARRTRRAKRCYLPMGDADAHVAASEEALSLESDDRAVSTVAR